MTFFLNQNLIFSYLYLSKEKKQSKQEDHNICDKW